MVIELKCMCLKGNAPLFMESMLMAKRLEKFAEYTVYCRESVSMNKRQPTQVTKGYS